MHASAVRSLEVDLEFLREFVNWDLYPQGRQERTLVAPACYKRKVTFPVRSCHYCGHIRHQGAYAYQKPYQRQIVYPPEVLVTSEQLKSIIGLVTYYQNTIPDFVGVKTRLVAILKGVCKGEQVSRQSIVDFVHVPGLVHEWC